MDARREGSDPAPDFSAVLVLLQGGRRSGESGTREHEGPAFLLRGSPGFMPPVRPALSRQRGNGGAATDAWKGEQGSLLAHEAWPRSAN
jgi:hypothetical protein